MTHKSTAPTLVLKHTTAYLPSWTEHFRHAKQLKFRRSSRVRKIILSLPKFTKTERWPLQTLLFRCLLEEYTWHFFGLPLFPYGYFLLFSVLMFPLFSAQATSPFFSYPFCPAQFQRLWLLIWYFPSCGQCPYIRYHLEYHCQGCKLQNNTATALSLKWLSWGASGMAQWVGVLTV